MSLNVALPGSNVPLVEAQLLGFGNTTDMAHKLFSRDAQFHLLFDNRKLRACRATGQHKHPECQRTLHATNLLSRLMFAMGRKLPLAS